MTEETPIGNIGWLVGSAAQLGEAVRAARRERGLTQDDVAFAAGVGRRFIVDLEAGKPTVRLESVLKVLGSLGIDLHATTR